MRRGNMGLRLSKPGRYAHHNTEISPETFLLPRRPWQSAMPLWAGGCSVGIVGDQEIKRPILRAAGRHGPPAAQSRWLSIKKPAEGAL